MLQKNLLRKSICLRLGRDLFPVHVATMAMGVELFPDLCCYNDNGRRLVSWLLRLLGSSGWILVAVSLRLEPGLGLGVGLGAGIGAGAGTGGSGCVSDCGCG